MYCGFTTDNQRDNNAGNPTEPIHHTCWLCVCVFVYVTLIQYNTIHVWWSYPNEISAQLQYKQKMNTEEKKTSESTTFRQKLTVRCGYLRASVNNKHLFVSIFLFFFWMLPEHMQSRSLVFPLLHISFFSASFSSVHQKRKSNFTFVAVQIYNSTFFCSSI